MPESLLFHTRTLSIVGDVLRIALPKDADEGPSFGDLAEIRDEHGRPRIAQVVKLDEDAASLQVFAGAKGLTTSAKVRFLGHPPSWGPRSRRRRTPSSSMSWTSSTACRPVSCDELLRGLKERTMVAGGSGIWGILEERIMDDLWMPILKTAKPRAGFELGIKLARHGVKATQPSDELRMQLRAAHAQDTTQLIAASQVVATYFQTMAASNWWQ
jgi:hypothetical protein